MSVNGIIEEIINVEGGYVNDPKDRGGETKYGITVAVARANGYTGAMRDLPRQTAFDIYKKQYADAPGFTPIIDMSEKIAAELVDTGVNMGPAVAAKFLQRALNALNREGKDYADVIVDGKCGPGTRAALKAYLAKRGKGGEAVMLKALDGLQCARYIELAEARKANEAFVYGWLANRVGL